MVGNVAVGGDAPISVQSMTNTLTTDIKGTLNQNFKLEAYRKPNGNLKLI